MTEKSGRAMDLRTYPKISVERTPFIFTLKLNLICKINGVRFNTHQGRY